MAHEFDGYWGQVPIRDLTPISIKLIAPSTSQAPGTPQSTPKTTPLQTSVTCAGVLSIQGRNEKRRGRQTTQGSRSTAREIPCNLARRFPLYGVEVDGLPLRMARREKETRATEP